MNAEENQEVPTLPKGNDPVEKEEDSTPDPYFKTYQEFLVNLA